MSISSKYILILCFSVFVVLTSGCISVSSDENFKNVNTAKNVSIIKELANVSGTGATFENQWVKFNYSSNFTINDSSTADHISITIYNKTKNIGEIYDDGTNINNYGSMPDSSATTIDGRKTLLDFCVETGPNGVNQTRPSAAIYLNENSSLNVVFDPDYRTSFNQVIKTLVIKKDNVKPKGIIESYLGL